MQLTFLQADKPLTKKYTKRPDGGYDSESYPMLFRVTSHIENVHSIEEFTAALKKHAELGHCLHTGSLDRQLSNESRKGHHDKDEQRSWIVLDLDGLSAFNGVEELVLELPPQFQDVSYIVQESPSSGIKPGLRAHVFFMLDQPVSMADVKTWIMETNLVTEKLRNEITLTAKNYALSYPLDRVANDNGRVVYITPPECVGFQDPVSDRIRIVSKARERLPFDFRRNIADIAKAEREYIDTLRAAAGLKKRKHDSYYDTSYGREVLRKELHEPGRVHPVRQDSDNIMRCNLDDGDSEAYYYLIDAPELLRNHKGEPFLRIKYLDRKFYDEVAMPAARAAWEKDLQPFVFRAAHNDKYYVGSRKGPEIWAQPHVVGSEPKIKAWFRQINMGIPAPDLDQIETWRMEFRPDLDEQWNPEERLFNTWRKTEIMSNATYRSLPPPVITKVITHAVGGGAEEYHRFINWLAYIYQRRSKTIQAWILHGTEGTGKGLLVDHILTPIFGWDYVVKQQSRNLKAEFNGFLEKALILNLDEFDLQDAGREYNAVMQALKMWISDGRFNIRRMHAESEQLNNYTNIIITTNSKNSIRVGEHSRRFSFGLRQEEKIQITAKEVALIKDELEHFAGYLSGYEVNDELVMTPLENEARAHAVEMSRTNAETFAEAVEDGSLRFFMDLLSQIVDHQDRTIPKQLMDQWKQEAVAGESSKVSIADLTEFYRAMGNRNATATTVKNSLEHYNVSPKRIRHPSGRVYGFDIEWKLDDEDRVELKEHIKPVKSTSEPDKESLQAPSGPPTMRT